MRRTRLRGRLGALAAVLVLAACSPGGAEAGAPVAAQHAQTAADGDAAGTAAERGSASSPATGTTGAGSTGATTASPAETTTSTPAVGAPTADAPPADAPTQDGGVTPSAAVSTPPSDDALAGVLSHDVPDVGDGSLLTVPGAVSAPGPGTLRRIKVSVEGGLPVDGEAFAAFVLRTLNDPHSWRRDGYAFSRTDGEHDTEVVLASPTTSRQMCRPLETLGTLSCRNGSRVILTWYRWVHGQEDFGGDLTGYRQYLVNHEVGHSLGHGHQSCPGAGQLAPVMMQQTKGVKPCLPNAWPYP